MTHRISNAAITIRPAYADDEAALNRLAALDSAEHAPAAPVLLAEVDGEVQAALSLRDGAAIADPFRATLHILALLRTHAEQTMRPATPQRRYRLRFA
jgi:hypothetical protein